MSAEPCGIAINRNMPRAGMACCMRYTAEPNRALYPRCWLSALALHGRNFHTIQTVQHGVAGRPRKADRRTTRQGQSQSRHHQHQHQRSAAAPEAKEAYSRHCRSEAVGDGVPSRFKRSIPLYLVSTRAGTPLEHACGTRAARACAGRWRVCVAENEEINPPALFKTDHKAQALSLSFPPPQKAPPAGHLCQIPVAAFFFCIPGAGGRFPGRQLFTSLSLFSFVPVCCASLTLVPLRRSVRARGPTYTVAVERGGLIIGSA